MYDFSNFGAWVSGTATSSRSPFMVLLVSMALVAHFMGKAVPLPLPDPYNTVAWFAAQLALGLLLLALLHHLRPSSPDDPPRSFTESLHRAFNPVLTGYVGLLLAGYCAHSSLTGTGGLGTLVFTAVGAMLAIAGFVMMVHNVLRRL